MTGLCERAREGTERHASFGRKRVVVMFVASALAAAGLGGPRLVSPARAADLPSGEVVIQKMIDAVGGKAAYDQAKSRFQRGKMSMPKMNVEMTMTSWGARPNLSYVLMESAALGKFESGCDGETVWETSMQGPSIKKGAERAIQLREADFDSWPNWRKYYKSATTTMADSVAGRPTWKVGMVPMEGAPDTLWFDQGNGLLLKMSTKLQTDMGEVPVDTYLEDYRDVCGTKMPFRTRQVIAGGVQEMMLTTDSVACNPEVPKDRFALPAEIKALLEKAKTEGATPAPAPATKGEGKK